ncbi:MAG: hypothetical protein K8S22_01495, partial [Betaproteobacteria bacterium]|nr:hypothetical protein [Betaproteobacteria bacterium]
DAWWGMFTRKGTPEKTIRILREAIVADLNSPEIRKILESQDAIGVGSASLAFADFLKAETTKWTKIAQIAGMTAD